MPEIKYLTKAEVLDIAISNLPLLTLTDSLYAWLGWAIKHHTSGRYNHAMWLYHGTGKYGTFSAASQGLMYAERPITDWLDDRHRIKFWYNPDWSHMHKWSINRAIQNGLNESWFYRLYDFLGVGGQLIHVPQINIPWRNYCSERSVVPLSRAEIITMTHPSPADLDKWCKEHKQMQVYGIYDPEYNGNGG